MQQLAMVIEGEVPVQRLRNLLEREGLKVEILFVPDRHDMRTIAIMDEDARARAQEKRAG